MSKIIEKIKRFWYFRIANPVLREGEAGGFKWSFRRFDMEIRTLSRNFKVYFTADDAPFAYLMSGHDEQTHGFAMRLYMIGKLMTRDQKFVDDIDKALNNYEKRLEKEHPVADDETEENIAIEEVKQVQEIVEMDKKARRNYERGVDGRFKKRVKEIEKIAGE